MDAYGRPMRSEAGLLPHLAAESVLETRVLLLVEDNPSDAELVREMLQPEDGGAEYHVHQASRLSEALTMLPTMRVDIILLDLNLPDAHGVDAVKAMQAISEDIPIIVLTGIESEAIALQCIDAGAQDYLGKDDLKPLLLRRSMGYAVARLREAQLREMQTLLGSYRALSSSGSATSVTASVAGVGSLRDRDPSLFEEAARNYERLLDKYLEQLSYKKEKPNGLMVNLSTQIGDAGGGPRDLLDVHVAALERTLHGVNSERGRAIMMEGRLLALEMMGLLVDFYRTGKRRRFAGGDLR